MSRAEKRLLHDLNSSRSSDLNIQVDLQDNLYICCVTIHGPVDTLHEKWKLEFTTEFLFTMPKVRFLTIIYHLNTSMRGAVCVDISTSKNDHRYCLLRKILLPITDDSLVSDD